MLVRLSFGRDAPNQAQDDDGIEARGQRHVTLDPFDSRGAHGRVVASERQPLFSPGLPRADGGHDQPVRRHDALQFVTVHQFGVANGELDTVVAHIGDLGDAGFKVALEYDCRKLGSMGGKNNTDLSQFKAINEIKAHTYGALYQSNLEDFILLDIGGQDVKAIKIEKGIITDIELNDKCAASCGRYLENMAQVLEVNLDELSNHFISPLPLNSTCAVFSESELIGKIAEGATVETLCASVNYSLYKRLKPLLNTFRSNKLVLSGGVAKNEAIKMYLNEDYEQVICLDDPQFNGAIGCCHYGIKFGG